MALTDIAEPLGGLEKLKITAFEDDTYARATKTYVVMYNPTTYSTEIKTTWIPEEGVSPDGRQLQFRSNQSDKASFEFLFDATGASPPGNDTPGNVDLSYLGDSVNASRGESVSAIEIIRQDKHVDRAIREFLNMAQTIQGDTHTPNYLQINWGAYQFRGVLTSATINYKLFNTSGLPIRATVSVTFQESISRQEQAAATSRSSPDLTHARVVQAGDTLPLLARKIYGDPSYYIEIARVNKLKNFRALKNGQQILLPPTKK